MNSQFRFIACFILFLSFITVGHSNHIVGGEASYEFLSYNSDTTTVSYRVTFNMFRDVNGQNAADFDNPAEFGIYRRNDLGEWLLYNSISVAPSNRTELVNSNYFCLANDPSSQISQEKAQYIFEIELDVSDYDYMISYQRCCRSITIGNIQDPGDTGFVLDVVITSEAQKTGNSSPSFVLDPQLFICFQSPIDISIVASDPDGDSLRYKFCSPFVSGGPVGGDPSCCDCVRPSPENCLPPYDNISYFLPFTEQQPAGASMTYTNQGQLTGSVEVVGQYTVGICVEEFRNGILLGKIRRDYAISVLFCDIDTSLAESFFLDFDGDGYGDPDVELQACILPSGYVLNNLDCDDANPEINPEAEDEAGDGIDMNCDGADWVLSDVNKFESRELKLFPNPSSTTIQLNTDFVLPYEIMNMHGTIFLKGSSQGQPIKIDQLKPGLYLMKVKGALLHFIKI